jgi:hypothetical protein
MMMTAMARAAATATATEWWRRFDHQAAPGLVVCARAYRKRRLVIVEQRPPLLKPTRRQVPRASMFSCGYHGNRPGPGPLSGSAIIIIKSQDSV